MAELDSNLPLKLHLFLSVVLNIAKIGLCRKILDGHATSANDALTLSVAVISGGQCPATCDIFHLSLIHI